MDTSSIISILHVLQSMGVTPFNFILILLVYFMGVKLRILPNFFGKKEVSDETENSVTLLDIHRQMKTLGGYFNHDTTERLKTVEDKQDQTLTMVTDLKRKHEEYDRYGILVRK